MRRCESMFEILFASWLPIAALILFISLIFIVIVYMIARALDNSNYANWAQNEIYQVLASALILGSLFIFLAIINNILLTLIQLINPGIDFQCSGSSCTFLELTFPVQLIGSPNAVQGVLNTKSCDPGYCHIEVAKSQLRTYYDITRFYLANKIVTVGWFQIFSTFRIVLFILSIQPFNGFQPLIDIYTNFLNTASYILIWLKTNEIFLTFISEALFPSFLIAGLALRSLSLFRGVGGLMLSIAIGTFFVYPMILLFSMTLISPDPNYHPIYITDESGFVAALPNVQFSPSQGNIISTKEVLYNQSNTNKNIVSFMGDLVGFVVNNLFLFSNGTISPNGFLDTIAFLSVWMTVPAIISIYGTLVFIKEFSIFLGGDIDIAGLSKLI